MSTVELFCIVVAMFAGAALSQLSLEGIINWGSIKRFVLWVLCICGIVFTITAPLSYTYITECTDLVTFGWIVDKDTGAHWGNPSFALTYFMVTFVVIYASVFGIVQLVCTKGKDK